MPPEPGGRADEALRDTVALGDTGLDGGIDPDELAITDRSNQAQAEAETPSRIGRFLVIRQVGQGGIGRVYAAYDERLDRRVAIKVLQREVGDTPRLRILREAKAMAKLSHPNVVQVFEVGDMGPHLFIAMEFIDGKTLDAWQHKHDRTWSDVMAAYIQAGEGLAAAHDVGMVHRDFKPQNVMVETKGEAIRVCVLDFGLARFDEAVVTEPTSIEDPPSEPSVHTRLTNTGAVMGTPAFMAPEQFRGDSVGAAADQFAFCVALWEGLYGEPPFDRTSVASLMTSVVGGDVRDPAPNHSVPRWVEPVLRRGMSVDADDRYPSMRALLDELTADRGAQGRRALRWVGGLALMGVGGLGLWAWTSARADRCAGADAHLAGIWDTKARAAAEIGVTGVDVAYARPTWDRVVADLDDYADQWRALHRDVCEATTVRGEQSAEVMDLRMLCLHRAKVELGAVSDVLASADEEVVRNATRLLGGLRPLSRCSDVEALRADVEPPLPEEAEAVESIRTALAQLRSEQLAGRYAQAGKWATVARSRLAGVEYGPVHTEVALHEGAALDSLGEYDAAAVALQEALTEGSRWHQWSQMQAAAANLMSVVGSDLGKPAEGLHYRAVAEGLAQGPEAKAMFRRSLASILSNQGKYEEAAQEHRRARELWIEARGPDDVAVARSGQNLANALRELGSYAEAEQELRAALAVYEAAVGTEHPDVASVHTSIGAVLVRQGKAVEGEQEHRRALQLWEAALGPDHFECADAHNNLAVALAEQGKYVEAEAEYRRAIELKERHLPKDHPDVAQLRNNLATTLGDQGKLTEAVAEHERVLDMRRKELGPDHPELIETYNNLSVLVDDLGRPQDAERYARAAAELAERALGHDHPKRAAALSNLAGLLFARDEPDEAERTLREALRIMETALGESHQTVAVLRANLAELLLHSGRTAKAVEEAERAWARFENDDHAPPGSRARAVLMLAETLAARNKGDDRTRAKALAHRGIELYESGGAPYESRIEGVRTWLAENYPAIGAEVRAR